MNLATDPSAHAPGSTAAAPARRRTLRLFLLEARYELLKAVRMPAYALPTLAFPLMFYAIFGLVFGGDRPAGGTTMATYMLATYGAFGVMGASLFGFGVGVAIERGQGWLLLKRASPMPPLAYFTAKLAMALVFSAIIVVSMGLLSVAVGGVTLPAVTWLRLGGALVAGAIPSCAFGLALGYFAGPNSAVPIVNLVYLPLAFASGLWIPITALPSTLQTIAVFLPPYHHAQLALATIGADRGGPAWAHGLVLAGANGVFLVLALVGYARDEGKRHG